MKQVQAVYQAIVNVLGENGIGFEDGMNASELLTDGMSKSITQVLMDGFLKGEIEFKDTPSNREKLSDEVKLRRYVNELKNNWLRKDTRLNGGDKYEIKNPGSRVGSGDHMLKALRGLVGVENVDQAEIEAAIEKRLSEIQPKKKVTINIDDLPEEIRAKYADLI